MTPQDYDEAEKAIICFVQKQRFVSEITSITQTYPRTGLCRKELQLERQRSQKQHLYVKRLILEAVLENDNTIGVLEALFHTVSKLMSK